MGKITSQFVLASKWILTFPSIVSVTSKNHRYCHLVLQLLFWHIFYAYHYIIILKLQSLIEPPQELTIQEGGRKRKREPKYII